MRLPMALTLCDATFAVLATAVNLYVGVILGLAVSYVTKYRLDRRFVFREQTA